METGTEGRQRQSWGDVATSQEALEWGDAGRSLPRGLRGGLIPAEPGLGPESASRTAREGTCVWSQLQAPGLQLPGSPYSQGLLVVQLRFADPSLRPDIPASEAS